MCYSFGSLMIQGSQASFDDERISKSGWGDERPEETTVAGALVQKTLNLFLGILLL